MFHLFGLIRPQRVGDTWRKSKMIQIRISQPVRRTLVWRYCAVFSLCLYVYAFYNLIAIITSNDSKKVSRHENPQDFNPELKLFSTTPFEMDLDQHRPAVFPVNSPSPDLNSLI